jgi:hypothetical protein
MHTQTRFTMKSIVSLFFLFMTFSFSQDIQPQPIPEATSIYTCGESFQPVDIEFDSYGNLYSTDRQFLNGLTPYNFGSDTQIQERINSVYIYLQERSICYPFLRTTRLLSGLTTNTKGEVCFIQGGFFEDNPYPYFRQSALLYIDEIKHNELICVKDTIEITLYPRVVGVGDIVFVGNDIWAISIGHSFSLDLSLHSALTRITKRRASYEDSVIPGSPSFLTRADDGSFFTSSYPTHIPLERANGQVNHFSSKAKYLMLVDPYRLTEDHQSLNIPTGIKTIDDHLLVADYKLGQLREYTFDGELKQIFEGLQGPMGITQAPNGDLCIAEMTGARVSCYSLTSLNLETP